ncbi:MAG: hypothetical protein M1827_002333 [Pycnora praestabilis]|nr:MAG: hypothetical protein M1827_002333 [Pycnora praestabilis]
MEVQTSYQQPTNPLAETSHGQQSSQSCYNCGSTDHWAQTCPEARRAVPPGGFNQPNVPRPLKRQKPNGPVITRYGPPPQSFPQQYGNQQGFGGPQYGQAPHAQQGGYYGPPTPVSGYPQPYQQWQQPPQHQYRASYSPGIQYPPYGPQGPPTPATPYGPQYPSPVSAQGRSQHNGFFPQNAHYPHNQGPPQYQDYGQSNPPRSLQTSAHGGELPFQAHQPRIGSSPEILYGNAINGNQPTPTEFAFKPPPAIEPWDEPEGPQAQTQIGQTVWHPAIRVARPLPATHAEAEVARFPLPSFKDGDQTCVSVHYSAANAHVTCLDVRKTDNWDNVKNDPVFCEIANDCDLIPLDALIAIRGRREEPAEDIDPDREEGELSQGSQMACNEFPNNQVQGGWNVMDNLEHSLNSRRFSPDQQHEEPAQESFDMAEMERLQEAEESTEERLARLGVTGQPKPVHVPARASLPDSLPRERQESTSQFSTRDGRKPEPLERRQSDPRQLYDQSTSAHGSRTHNASSSDNGKGDGRKNPDVDDVRRYSYPRGGRPQAHNVPTSSAVSIKKRFSYDGANDSPPSSGSGQSSVCGVSNGQGHSSHGHNAKIDDTPSASPGRATFGNANPRKRDYDQRDRSEERDNGPLRQADDVTPKLKRRQPRVADAYSRRW